MFPMDYTHKSALPVCMLPFNCVSEVKGGFTRFLSLSVLAIAPARKSYRGLGSRSPLASVLHTRVRRHAPASGPG